MTSSKCLGGYLQDVFNTSWKTRTCYTEDVFNMSSRHVFKTCLQDVFKTCFEDVFKIFFQDVFKTHLDDLLETKKGCIGKEPISAFKKYNLCLTNLCLTNLYLTNLYLANISDKSKANARQIEVALTLS